MFATSKTFLNLKIAIAKTVAHKSTKKVYINRKEQARLRMRKIKMDFKLL